MQVAQVETSSIGGLMRLFWDGVHKLRFLQWFLEEMSPGAVGKEEPLKELIVA